MPDEVTGNVTKKKGRKPTATLPEAERERAVQAQIEGRLLLVSPAARVEMLTFFLNREKRGLESGARTPIPALVDDRQTSIEGA